VRAGGGDARFVPCDVTDQASVTSAVAAAVEAYGGLHVLYNCAGGSLPEDGSVVDTDLDVWRRTLDLNLLGSMLCARSAFPWLVRSGAGSIINMSSITALQGGVAGDMYSATKGAVISLTRSLAARGSEHGVRANAIAPGTVLTERVTSRMGMSSPADPLPAVLRDFAAGHPMSVGSPDDIAAVALFLASDESRMVTGALIPAEGGLSAF